MSKTAKVLTPESLSYYDQKKGYLNKQTADGLYMGKDELEVTASKSGSVTTLTIKDGTGTHTTQINDGAKGDKGDTGANGSNATINGVSTLTINASGGVTSSQSESTLTLGLETSGVTAGTYGPFINGLCWLANNKGIKSTTATWTLVTKKAGALRFSYAGGGEETYDYITVTLNGSEILNTKNFPSPYGGYVETTVASGDTLVFNHIEDGSNFYDGDYAAIGNITLGSTNSQFDAITPANISTYFTVTNGTYTFTPSIMFMGVSTTVDAKGRVTKATNSYPTIYSLAEWKTATGVKDGVTFTPSVSSAGVLSWTNNGGLTNPSSVNIKGAKGDKGDTGATGATGAKGATGATGAKGADGVVLSVDTNTFTLSTAGKLSLNSGVKVIKSIGTGLSLSSAGALTLSGTVKAIKTGTAVPTTSTISSGEMYLQLS